MITLQQLFTQLNQHELAQNAELFNVKDLPFQKFCVDSRQIQDNDVFILLKSQNPNQTLDIDKIASYIHQVADKAVFILSEIDPKQLHDKIPQTICICYFANIRNYLGSLIQASLQTNQSASLPTVIAVTGTNGKTTISQLIAQLISNTGKKTAVMGTAGNGILPNLQPASHTTLEAFHLHHYLYQMALQHVDVLSIEASSHGLHQQRLQGIPVKVAVYTNLSRDHLDYHQDMDDYARAKSRLFDRQLFPSLTHAIINIDDDYGQFMQQVAEKSGLIVWRYSLNHPKTHTNAQVEFFTKHIEPSLTGVDLVIQTPTGEMTLTSPLLGRFNVANLLAGIATAMALGVSQSHIIEAVTHLQGATGRMQRIASRAGCFIVDYAHTPDALSQVLHSLKAHCHGKLWAVFGCGGDRDKGKRPLMTQSALAIADKVVLTADNPRSEDPLAILNDMQVGMSCEQHYKTHIEANRKTAIEYAVQHSADNDIVVIAGKGHETYQEIQGIRHDFDDRQIVALAIEKFQK